MADGFVLIVRGQLATAGNKTGYPRQGKNGKIHVRMVEGRDKDARARIANWRADIKAECERVMAGAAPLDGPLIAALTISVRRPGGLPERRRTPAGMVPVRHYPTTRPDLIKYTRLIEDAVTAGGGWADDARVIRYRRLAKFYAGDGERYGEPDVLASPGMVLRCWPVPSAEFLARVLPDMNGRAVQDALL